MGMYRRERIEQKISLNINGYVQEREDRTENCGGGWLAYISENLEYKRKLDLESSNIETIWFEIKPCHKKSFLLCFVYRKPIASELVEWIDKFESELNNAILLNSDIVLTGNFNITFLPCKTSQKWLSILETYNLNQIVPTY